MKTLADKIDVMLAAQDGKEIEQSRAEFRDGEWIRVHDQDECTFNWGKYDYRIKPEPREFYVNFFSDGGEAIYRTKEEAVFGSSQCETIKVREVTDEDS